MRVTDAPTQQATRAHQLVAVQAAQAGELTARWAQLHGLLHTLRALGVASQLPAGCELSPDGDTALRVMLDAAFPADTPGVRDVTAVLQRAVEAARSHGEACVCVRALGYAATAAALATAAAGAAVVNDPEGGATAVVLDGADSRLQLVGTAMEAAVSAVARALFAPTSHGDNPASALLPGGMLACVGQLLAEPATWLVATLEVSAVVQGRWHAARLPWPLCSLFAILQSPPSDNGVLV